MKREGWRKDEFNNCLSSAAGNTNASWLPPSPTSASPSSQPPSLHPFQSKTLPFPLSIILPDTFSCTGVFTTTRHHKYKAIHTREGSCRGCQTVTHGRLSEVSRLPQEVPTHLQQQIQEPPVNFYTAARILLQLHTYTHAQTSPKPTHHPDSSSSALNALDDSMHLVCSRIHMQ